VPVKLYLEEDITASSQLAATLRQHGFDAIGTIEAGNRKQDDRAQFAFAVTEQQVLLTFKANEK